MKRLLVLAAIASLGTAIGQPATAAEPNAGGGTLTGSVAFGANGTAPIPPVNTPCRPVAFTFNAFATVAVRNLGGSGWAGTIGNPEAQTGVSGSGSSTCENAAVGGGTFVLDAISTMNPLTTGTLHCHGLAGPSTPLTGSYTRTLTDLFAVVGGRCAINQGVTDNVAIVIRAQLVPNGTVGDGVAAGISSAAMVAAFTVVPAGRPLPGG